MTRTPHLRALAVVATLLALALTGCASQTTTRATTDTLVQTGSTGTTSVRTASVRTASVRTVGLAAERAAAITYRTVRTRQKIAFRISTVRTDRLPRGVRKVARWGHPGVRVITWRVKLRDGRQVSRKRVHTAVVRRPVSRIVRLGTGTRGGGGGSHCDPNYSGACVPIASDVDCGGGSGNGPAYVYGTVHVIGNDIYGLDSDGDGYGCE